MITGYLAPVALSHHHQFQQSSSSLLESYERIARLHLELNIATTKFAHSRFLRLLLSAHYESLTAWLPMLAGLRIQTAALSE